MRYFVDFVDENDDSIELPGEEGGPMLQADHIPFLPATGESVYFMHLDQAYRVVSRSFTYGEPDGWSVVVRLETVKSAE